MFVALKETQRIRLQSWEVLRHPSSPTFLSNLLISEVEKQAQRNGLQRPQRVGGRTKAGILTPPACQLLDTLISLVELSTVPGHQGLSPPWVGCLMCQLVPAHSLFWAVALLLIQGWVN